MSNQPGISTVEGGASSRQIGRSAWAIVAGFLVVVILSLLTDIVLNKLRIYPPLGQRLSDQLAAVATAYRTIYAILGSYITARLAPNRPLGHALVGGVIGMVIGTVGAIATWNKDLGPHWYAIALAVEGIPCAWIGAKIREFQILK